MNRLAYVGWVGMFLLGCGDKGDFVSKEPASLALEELPGALAAGVCDAYLRCFPFYAAAFGSVDDCAERIEDQFVASSFRLIESAVEEERVGYDGAQAEKCLTALAAADCSDIDLRNIEACDTVFEGTVDRGGACTLNEECVGKSICSFEDSCPGTCAALLRAGEACVDNDQCESGLVCSEATARCVVPAGEGDLCDFGEPQCVLPLICLGQDEDNATPGTCHTQEEAFTADEGDACNFIGDDLVLCQEGLGCVVEEFSLVSGIVSHCRSFVGSGEPCGLAIPSICPADEYCAGIDLVAGTFEGTCERLPEEGESCSATEFNPCAVGLYCMDSECVALRQNGESCSESTECVSEYCVDGGCAPQNSCE